MHSPDAAPIMGQHAGDRLIPSGQEQFLTLAEERAVVTTRGYESGLVRVRTVTESADHVEHATLQFETAEVTHHPINQFVDAVPQPREDGDVMILPVVEERLVVEKRLFVTEEIHIRRKRTTEEVALPVSLRRQHAVIERIVHDAGEPQDAPDAAAQRDLNQ